MLPRYNYHTHTKRCGHASFSNDKEYIKKYIINNFKNIGFSDHMPNTKYQLVEEKNRMDISHFNNYLKSIKRLKKQFKNILILTGLECEYSKLLGRHICNLKEKCDYLILGQHYIDNINPIGNIDYPILYAERICEALDTGLFDFIAHPDYFLKFRDTIKPNDMNIYITNTKECFKRICNKAKKLDIPLEINLNFINNVKIMNDNQYPYPHTLLFDIANIIGNKCVIGIDAHNPNVINKYKDSFNKVLRHIPKLNIIYDYNPITYRNKTLDKKYIKYKKNIHSFKYYYLKDITKIIPYNANNNEIIKTFITVKENVTNRKNDINNKLYKDINMINNSILDINEKDNLINRKKEYININEKRYKEQYKILNDIIKIINKYKHKYKGKQLIKKIKEYYSKER